MPLPATEILLAMLDQKSNNDSASSNHGDKSNNGSNDTRSEKSNHSRMFGLPQAPE